MLLYMTGRICMMTYRQILYINPKYGKNLREFQVEVCLPF